MTEPIKNITFGGVQFNENDIKQKQQTKDKNGNTRYSVFLKNGVKLEYPEQPKQAPEDGKLKHYYYWGEWIEDTKENVEKMKVERGSSTKTNLVDINPKVTTSVDGMILKDYYTNIEDIQGAKIIGSNNVDYIKLTGNAQNNIIDVSVDNNFRGDEVRLGGYHNEVTLDKSDSAVIKGKEIDGPGTAATDSY